MKKIHNKTIHYSFIKDAYTSWGASADVLIYSEPTGYGKDGNNLGFRAYAFTSLSNGRGGFGYNFKAGVETGVRGKITPLVNIGFFFAIRGY